MVLLPAEIATGLTTVLDCGAFVARDRSRGLSKAVAAVVHLFDMIVGNSGNSGYSALQWLTRNTDSSTAAKGSSLRMTSPGPRSLVAMK